MCAVCIEYGKGKITPREALNALNEVVQTEYDKRKVSSEEAEHFNEVWHKLHNEESKNEQV